MQNAPKGLRLHIGIFGRRNVGKSSFLNALTRQQTSIVSDIAGTTTDPVEKPVELLPLGPVLFIDTAGIDDDGALGTLRVKKTRGIFDRTDIAVLVAEGGKWSSFEEELIAEFAKLKIPVIVVFNKADIEKPNPALTAKLKEAGIFSVETAAKNSMGICEFRDVLIKIVPEEFIARRTIAGDLIPDGGLAVLVVPIDLEAPKGRLILPQVQTIRDILDSGAYCIVVRERELRDSLKRLKHPPDIVITDSQAFLKVAEDTPDGIPLTSFSILFARFKGDLNTFVEGALQIGKLRPGDKILIAEACAHHPIGEDIGRVKIPRWLMQYAGGKLEFEHSQGFDFPDDLKKFRLVIHCGSCTFNRRALLSRILKCKEAGVPITNYGVAIAYSVGVIGRALGPFPDALAVYKKTTAVPCALD